MIPENGRRATAPWKRLLPVVSLIVAGCAFGKVVELFAGGDDRKLRERPEGTPTRSPVRPGVLVLALDGVDRKLLYDMIERGDLPGFSKLLGGSGSGSDAGRAAEVKPAQAKFAHAYFDESMLSTLPSTTIAAWVTAFTGTPPSVHGVTGNEFFMRPSGKFAAPVPVSFGDAVPVLKTYTDHYVDLLIPVPTVYERMRKKDPNVRIWVAMSQVQRGADQLLVTRRAVVSDAFATFFAHDITARVTQRHSKEMWATLDTNVVDTVIEQLADRAKPAADVITVYLAGIDNYAHIAESGPDEARREYLREVVDPLIVKLVEALAKRHELDDRYVVMTSDHGHTEVLHDDEHALSTENSDDPPTVLERAGFRVRPFKLDVSDDDDFDSVLAYQGAIAFVYLADRSTCPKKKQRCDYSRPPRFEQDVLVAADAFFRTSHDGKYVPKMKGTLDMVLTRRPRPFKDKDLPFEVYVGGGRLVPVKEYLAANPHPTYVDLDERLRDLAEGPLGERAGDVLLIANNGNRDRPEQRYYFSFRYHSWHGSPSRQDSEVPLIVAHPHKTTDELSKVVKHALGARPYQQKVTDLLLALRLDQHAPSPAPTPSHPKRPVERH